MRCCDEGPNNGAKEEAGIGGQKRSDQITVSIKHRALRCFDALNPGFQDVSTMPTSCSHYFAGTIRGAERAGVDTDLLLANVGLTRAQILDPHWRGDVELLARLVQLLWYALDDEFMGFISRPAKPGTFAMMTHNMMNSPSIYAAVQKGVLFYRLVNDGLTMSFETHGHEASLTVSFTDPALDPEHYFLEFWLVIWYRLVGWLGGGLPPLTRAAFAYPLPQKYIEEFKHMFRCEYVFDSPKTALYFDARFLQQPLVRSREELKVFLSTAPVGFMMIPADETSFGRRIRTLLLSGRQLPLNFPPFEVVAEQLHMTEQTLRRKLKDESTSYRAIKETIRRDVAVEKLLGSSMAVDEVSSLLGYSESRAFTRAFLQWTGLSPAKYRARVKAEYGKA
ncbi:MAG: AraC family transcriptional regulator [Xanthobacteraceae bacterium]